MSKIKPAVQRKKRHKKIIKMAKGYTGRNKNCYRVARERVERAMLYEYRDRKNKKREFRKLWIQRINASVREFGFTYSFFMGILNKIGLEINRKMLSELAINNKPEFKKIISTVKNSIK